MGMVINTAVPIGSLFPLPTISGAHPAILPPRHVYGPRAPMLQTARLRLRRWESRDVTPFVHLCSDLAIMQFFGGTMQPLTCFQEMERQETCFDAYQYGIWAVELKETGEFVGCVGIDPTMLNPKGMTARLTWKLRRECWSMNYAYEAAMEVMDYAFHELEVKQVFAHVIPTNLRSLRLVERLGLTRSPKEDDCYYKTNL